MTLSMSELAPAPTAEKHRGTLRVLTINIWMRCGPSEARFELLRAGIARLKPDIIAMQEVLSDGGSHLADTIVEGMGFNTVYGPANPWGGGITLGNAICSRFPIVDHKVHTLPSGGTQQRRSMLLTHLETPFGELPMVSTHLSWQLDYGFVRELQVLAIADYLEQQRRDTRLPALVAGDFNARSNSSEIRFLSGLHALHGRSIHLTDCFEAIGEGSGMTFDGTRNPFAVQAHEFPRRLDYIFSEGPDATGRGCPTSAEVVLTEVVDDVAASDHFGVLATLAY